MSKPIFVKKTNCPKSVPAVLLRAKKEATIQASKKRDWDKAWDNGPWDKGHWANRR